VVPASRREKVLPPLGLLALAAVYLLYWPHAEYVVDDWLHLRFYLGEPGGSFAGHLRALRDLAENRMYGVFQFDFLSRWINYALVRGFGYAPQLVFGLAVLAHTAGAWFWYLLLVRLGLGRRAAWLAAAALVLIPVAHGALFWPLNCSFFVWPMFWLPVYLLAFRGALGAERVKAGRGALLAVLLLLVVVFSGSPAIGLALGAPLWMALCCFERRYWKRAAALAALSWVVAGGTLLLYRGYLNAEHARDSRVGSEAEARYDFSYDYFRVNLMWTRLHLQNLNGVKNSYYDVTRLWGPAAVGLGMTLLVGVLLGAMRPAGRPGVAARVALFAGGLLVLAYAPVAFLNSKTLRHYYTMSPGLAMLLALPAAGGRRRGSIVYGGLLCGYFAACTVAEIEQSWVPQSEELQALKGPLKGLVPLAAHDWIVVPETHLVRGTAPYFGIGGGPWDRYFAEYLTGVPDLEFAREIVVEQGKLRFYHFYFMRDVTPEDRGRIHVLAPDGEGRYRARRYVAWEREPGRFQVLALKGAPEPASGAALVSREELRGQDEDVYFPKPFEHGNPQQQRY
jgi:hypothetical protein